MTLQSSSLTHIKHIILVGSGKGGVGKSTVSANLACALARMGHRVGLLDADIYGPSMPTLFGCHEHPAVVETPQGQKLSPVKTCGIELISMGFLVPKEDAIIWRGPMLSSAINQFLKDVAWSPLDYLVVDLPPGTGDIQMTFGQLSQTAQAILVGTPQTVALVDVVRAKAMFDKLEIPIIGIVENMSYFVCNKCQEKHFIFDQGGCMRLATKTGLEFLGDIPLLVDVRRAGDEGTPTVAREPDSLVGKAFLSLAERVVARVQKLKKKSNLLNVLK